MDKKVQEHIRSLSNADLIQYINAPPDTYLPEAVDFARGELTGRNLSAEQVQAVEEDLAAREAKEIEDANAPLDPVWEDLELTSNTLTFLTAWMQFKRTGRTRMAREVMRIWLSGAAFWTIVAILGLLIGFLLTRR